MVFTAGLDGEFEDAPFDVAKYKKRLIRVTHKTYERTGTYIFLKLFKKGEYDYELQQRITLTLEEFEKLTKKAQKIRSAAHNSNDNDSTTKPTPAKRPELKQKDDEQELSDQE